MYHYYNYYDEIIYETDVIIEKILKDHNYKLQFISNGWLKPHKQLKPFNSHSKITYNLLRNRGREKKQIFIQAA